MIVVGGGQAGLAIGHALQERSCEVLVLDAGPGPGASWRKRWDSLRLFTPAAFSSLPGMAFPGAADALPTKDEMADYLALYQRRHQVPVRWNTRVDCLEPGPAGTDGRYRLHTTAGRLAARAIVVATGAFQRPHIPLFADLGPDVCQVHSSSYRNPDQLPDGPVLVVGSGNSGLQIAEELVRTRPTTLACGGRHPVIPQSVAGRNIFWWTHRLGIESILRRIRPTSLAGRWLRRRREVVVGNTPRRLSRLGVKLAPRIVRAHGCDLTAADGSVHRPRTVVWATGFVPDFDWIRLGGDGERRLGLACGTTRHLGLYTMGQPWQCSMSSGLIFGINYEAPRLADRIAASLRQRP